MEAARGNEGVGRRREHVVNAKTVVELFGKREWRARSIRNTITILIRIGIQWRAAKEINPGETWRSSACGSREKRGRKNEKRNKEQKKKEREIIKDI